MKSVWFAQTGPAFNRADNAINDYNKNPSHSTPATTIHYMTNTYSKRYPLFFLIFALSACNDNNDGSKPPAQLKTATISTLTAPPSLTTGQRAVFVATGQNLNSANIQINASNCDNIQIQQMSATQIRFSCQPAHYGQQQVTISTDAKKILLRQTGFVDSAASHLLNDTGIVLCMNDNNQLVNQCATDESGKWLVSTQDAAAGRDLLASKGQLSKTGHGKAGFDFAKISANGEVLAANSNNWQCILDYRTGLLWEAKTTDGGLHDVNTTYAWYNPDDNDNGGNSGQINDSNNTLAFVNAVNQAGLCGYHDWRLPDITELQSIVDYGSNNPAIDTQYFSPVQNDAYWSSSSFSDGVAALGVSFDYGMVRNYYKVHRFVDTVHFVRLVRSAPSSR